MAREVHAERAWRKRSVEEKQSSSFPSLPRPKEVTWILYESIDRDKSLLLEMTCTFNTSFFPYPSPLFSVTHQMELSSYL
ncbi:hypothetical protein EJD97_015572 [Solanum chilense]|uniref:Uncharacterized protein n=1 Tax=Solanum chilense TaxID=4083 RepID=A0A6N2B962_SOLCI|nr:hypothetical protein EJD97_015572 [Solanum chilense]